ncbi:MAG: hypothetical protein LBS84_02660 [Clostridiales bacterium]|jgi:hypothetical protein|nr:hypothetical protein [Clostridiales bacterium]
MMMIIGGLLVSVLLSPQANGPTDILAYAYCVTYAPHIRIEKVNRTITGIKENPQLMKIDELIGAIDEKNRSLKNLLKEKTKVIDKIQTLLDFRVYTKKPFDDAQLDSFTRFTGFYNQEAGALQDTLLKIDTDKELMAAKKELLHKEANYTAVIDELSSFNDSLSDAIRYLRGIIEFGNSTLQVL